MSLNPTQEAFVRCKDPYPAFVGGFGSGKTAAAIARAMTLKVQYPQCDIAYYLPTYPLIEDIAFRRFPELLDRKGWGFNLNRQSCVIQFPDSGRIIFRSMERPDRIVGYEVAHSICDELDTLPLDKAREVWNKVIARNRQKCPIGNTVGVATTPEGFRFVYERWVKNPAIGYVLFRAKSQDNEKNLPPGYIENLRNSYPTNLLAAYLEGDFVNLTAGSVYSEFDRHLNSTTETIRAGEPLHIGVDFNVNNMSAVIFVLRDGDPHAVEELSQIRDTPTLIQVMRERYAGHAITVYPDASGGAHKSVNASLSDITLLRSAGFTILAHSKNPNVRDRLMSVNLMIHTQGKRRLKVHFDACPTLVECLERQAYDKNGEPDKSAGHDHMVDAMGYFISYKYSITRGPVRLARVVGV